MAKATLSTHLSSRPLVSLVSLCLLSFVSNCGKSGGSGGSGEQPNGGPQLVADANYRYRISSQYDENNNLRMRETEELTEDGSTVTELFDRGTLISKETKREEMKKVAEAHPKFPGSTYIIYHNQLTKTEGDENNPESSENISITVYNAQEQMIGRELPGNFFTFYKYDDKKRLIEKSTFNDHGVIHAKTLVDYDKKTVLSKQYDDAGKENGNYELKEYATLSDTPSQIADIWEDDEASSLKDLTHRIKVDYELGRKKTTETHIQISYVDATHRKVTVKETDENGRVTTTDGTMQPFSVTIFKGKVVQIWRYADAQETSDSMISTIRYDAAAQTRTTETTGTVETPERPESAWSANITPQALKTKTIETFRGPNGTMSRMDILATRSQMSVKSYTTYEYKN